MKKTLFILFPLALLLSCFEDVDNSLGRDQFIGNYDFVLTCEGSNPNSTHLIFIEKPIGNSDSLSAVVIIRNLINQNRTIQGVISQNDIILFDDTIIGTGTLNINTNELDLSISFGDNTCTGKGTRRL